MQSLLSLCMSNASRSVLGRPGSGRVLLHHRREIERQKTFLTWRQLPTDSLTSLCECGSDEGRRLRRPQSARREAVERGMQRHRATAF